MKKNQIINSRGEVVELDDSDVIPDGWGVRVSSFLMDGVPTTVMDEGDKAREAYKARLQDAWRGGKKLVDQYIQDTSDNAREAYISRMSNAWKTGQAVSWTEPPRPVHNARPAHEAWGGPWKNESAAANPKPPDVAMDSAPNADAAHAALVRRTENAWKTGGTLR